ncbi:LCP family protein [Corynebacterium epidermidicanis]|uniref:Transcriptional attenuator, LytR family n=1 Tax=Corynebacterium epidermidicanis TaxID=1050174 RepID=A0A0G3GPK5_9CORY|nr:LCP family protein [Corynebacterium epidermidicanis]AKK02520.1 transcriptional attenuator, LytR family [Corynebacterium epidermidicanis]
MTDKRRQARKLQAAPLLNTTVTQAGSTPARVVLALLSALVLIISGAGYASVGRLGNDVASAGGLSLGGGSKGTKDAKDGATDILLVGSDSRSDAQGNPLSPEEIGMLRAGDEENDNTDTIMVIRIPNDGSSATAISIPRDTYIHDDTMGNMKINGVYRAYKDARRTELSQGGLTNTQKLDQQATEAGRKALLDAVAKLTGITVDHYAEIGLLGFVLFTNAVGGVEVCLNEDTQDEYSGANFKKGRQTLEGPDALSFVRQRHGLPRGDLDRIVRQQAFMASLVNRVLATGTLTNPAKLNSLANAVRRSVVIDQDWDVMGFATQLQNLAGGNVKFDTIPVTSIDGTGDYGESVVTVDPVQVRAFFDTLLGSKSTASASPTVSAGTSASPSNVAGVSLHILNATPTTGFGASVAAPLKDAGYRVAEVGNAPQGLYSQSQVVAADPNNPKAIELATKLGGVPVTASQSLDSDSLVVVVAEDYAGPRSTEPQATQAPEAKVVGQPGGDFGQQIDVSPKLDAGGDGPRCVN